MFLMIILLGVFIFLFIFSNVVTFITKSYNLELKIRNTLRKKLDKATTHNYDVQVWDIFG